MGGEERTCDNVGCGQSTTSGGKACATCRVAVYCGKDCLKKHAKAHKKECAAIAKQGLSRRDAKEAEEAAWARGVCDRTMAAFQQGRRPHFVALSCFAWMRQREMGEGACIFRVLGPMCQENLLVFHVVSIGELELMARKSRDKVWDRALKELRAVDVSRGFKIEIDLEFEGQAERRRWRGEHRISPMVEYAVPDGDACAEHAKLISEHNLHERFENEQGGFFEVLHLEPFVEGVAETDALLEEAVKRVEAKRKAAEGKEAAAEADAQGGEAAGGEGASAGATSVLAPAGKVNIS